MLRKREITERPSHLSTIKHERRIGLDDLFMYTASLYHYRMECHRSLMNTLKLLLGREV